MKQHNQGYANFYTYPCLLNILCEHTKLLRSFMIWLELVFGDLFALQEEWPLFVAAFYTL